MSKPAAFLDRDGVINVDKDFVFRKEDFEWIPGAQEAIRWFNDNGYLVVIVTNQSGIGRQKFSEEDFWKLQNYISEELKKSHASIDAVYFCPHHPVEALGKYRVDCQCRKPKSGMLESAIAEHTIDRAKSFLIGDKDRDIEAAQGARVRGFKYPGDLPLDKSCKE